MLIATFVAPAAAVVLAVLDGEGLDAILRSLLIGMLTVPGIYAYVVAFPVGKRVCSAVGAMVGAGVALCLGGASGEMMLAGAVAGGACALTYLLIVGGSFEPVEPVERDLASSR